MLAAARAATTPNTAWGSDCWDPSILSSLTAYCAWFALSTYLSSSLAFLDSASSLFLVNGTNTGAVNEAMNWVVPATNKMMYVWEGAGNRTSVGGVLVGVVETEQVWESFMRALQC